MRRRWRCALRLHYPALYADYHYFEPPDPYWHCAECGVDCYPLRWRIMDRIWETRLGDWWISRGMKDE